MFIKYNRQGFTSTLQLLLPPFNSSLVSSTHLLKFGTHRIIKIKSINRQNPPRIKSLPKHITFVNHRLAEKSRHLEKYLNVKMTRL